MQPYPRPMDSFLTRFKVAHSNLRSTALGLIVWLSRSQSPERVLAIIPYHKNRIKGPLKLIQSTNGEYLAWVLPFHSQQLGQTLPTSQGVLCH